ncbi:TrbC/VirB2 family protein [Desulfovibrio sp. SGI.169]|uniref:TrbC/VirB2 family protein n=1 Tax=Desulfovibrio sp. SGI.169 TaxID=3420561 RepID=UPI003D04F7B5
MGETMYRKAFFLAFLAFFPGVCPDLALASGGITEFAGPLEKVVNTITGPAGKYISITAVGICGIIYLMNREDISGAFKMLLGVVAGISFIAFAGSMVNSTFSFSGAVL